MPGAHLSVLPQSGTDACTIVIATQVTATHNQLQEIDVINLDAQP